MSNESMSGDLSQLVTRKILREELEKFEAKFDLKLEYRFNEFRELIRQDTQSAMGVLLADFQRSLSLALEPTYRLPDKVQALKTADLPRRVTRLEEKVFPPKRTSRRRASRR